MVGPWVASSSGLAVAVVAGGGTVVVRTLGLSLGASAVVDAPLEQAARAGMRSTGRRSCFFILFYNMGHPGEGEGVGENLWQVALFSPTDLIEQLNSEKHGTGTSYQGE